MNHGRFLLGFQLQNEEDGLEDDYEDDFCEGVDLDEVALMLGNSYEEFPQVNSKYYKEDHHLLTTDENLSVVTESNSHVDNNNTKVVFYPN